MSCTGNGEGVGVLGSLGSLDAPQNRRKLILNRNVEFR